MTSPYDDTLNPFQEDGSASPLTFDAPSLVSTPSIEHVQFTPDGTAVDSSQSTVNGQFGEHSKPTGNPAVYPSARPAGFKNDIDRYLHSGDDAEILIVDAVKTTENSSSPYIVYVIRTGNEETRRRYSEFEAFRNVMTKLYPTLIIPPIPSKQSLGDYAVKQAKAKEDAALIARRKRMLQVFLNRISRHDILSTEVVFHRFLSGDVSWAEIARSPPLTLLPKNILKAPAHNPLDASSAIAYAALPSPSASATLRQPDQRFQDSEVFTSRFASHLSGNMEKVTRRTMKRWSEYSHDHAELGAALNAFSLSESGNLAPAIERIGQAVDATYISTARLLQDFEQVWTEPLHEYSQFGDIIRKLLQYRHQKHVQYELTLDSLETRRENLEELEKSEIEARRLEAALVAVGVRPKSASVPATGHRGEQPNGVEGDIDDIVAESRSSLGQSLSLPPSPAVLPRRNKSPSGGLLSALSHSIHGMMDVDPEAARRSSISKTKDAISHLEDAQHLSAQDLKYASSIIQADLDRFQRQKVADLREMCIGMARIHLAWCKANLEAWEAAKAEIAAIEPHPNKPPLRPAAKDSAGPSGATATK
ncbi:uncharacterized protein EI90DRAFT_2926124 [Cantharellus anzutake]|uniref:uncharacterized protein n=1 Tax=Cantharellus anzutake TaxID=1750568 RepID=UPI0019087AF9|nr:uncharacterized protein EI90DRAFT_2926124 [Cantharellus anzutake]KAF8328408.1 hypothetical protein EI90DRAFT_2926124 [Cantharellus anzutake]